jgi:hypothetical protein
MTAKMNEWVLDKSVASAFGFFWCPNKTKRGYFFWQQAIVMQSRPALTFLCKHILSVYWYNVSNELITPPSAQQHQSRAVSSENKMFNIMMLHNILCPVVRWVQFFKRDKETIVVAASAVSFAHNVLHGWFSQTTAFFKILHGPASVASWLRHLCSRSKLMLFFLWKWQQSTLVTRPGAFPMIDYSGRRYLWYYPNNKDTDQIDRRQPNLMQSFGSTVTDLTSFG